MSSFSEIRARAGNDILSDTINKLISEANMAEAITEQITISDKISPITILRDKLTVTDANMMTCSVKPRNNSFVYFMPNEPDGKFVRMDLRFDHGGEYLTDYSLMKGNETEIGFDTTQPVLIKGSYDDGVTSGKISSILDGTQHYYKSPVNVNNSIKKMVEQNYSGFSFVKRCFTISIFNEANSSDTQRAILADFIENDQVEYAVRVEISTDGIIYFYVRYKYQDYYLKTSPNVITWTFEIADYAPEDYSEIDYNTETPENRIEYPIPYVDLGFTFNFTTKVLQIYKNGILIAYTPYSANFDVPQFGNLSLWLPLTKGGGELLSDISGYNNNGSFAAITPASEKPSWIVQDGRRLLEFADTDYFTIPKTTSLNTFTSFTISFILYMHADYFSINHTKVFFATGHTGTGRLTIYSSSGTARNLNLDAHTDASGSRFMGFGSTMLPDTVPAFIHVVVTYDGTTYKGYVNKVIGTQHAFSGDTFTNSSELRVNRLVSSTLGGHVNISHLMVWKNRALTQAEIDRLYDIVMPQVTPVPTDMLPLPASSSTAVFPPGYDEPAAPPPPGTPYQEPFTKIYDHQTVTSPVVLENLKINKITVSDQTSIYNVAKGTPVSDPYVPVYDVPAGIQTDSTSTLPVSTIYNLAAASSTGTIEDNELAYVQRIANTSSVLYNTKPTDMQFWVDSNGSANGTVFPAIIRDNGTYTKFGSGIAASTLGSGWVEITGQSFVDRPVLVVGDGVGIVWEGKTQGQIKVRRGGTGNHFDKDANNVPRSWQHLHDGTTWATNNDDFSIAGVVKIGGTTTGAVVLPYIEIQNVSGQKYQVGEIFVSGAVNINKKIHKIEWYVWRDVTINTTPTAPTVSLYHMNTTTGVRATLKTVDVSTLPTTQPTTPNFIWEDPLYDNAIVANEKFVISVTGLTTGKVKVMHNNGANSGTQNHDTNKAYHVTRDVGGTTWNTASTYDISGKMYTGGNDFVPYIRLDHSRKRVGIKLDTTGSDLLPPSAPVTKVRITAQKSTTAVVNAAMYCRIRDSAGNERITLGQADTSVITTANTDTTIEFLNTGNNLSFNVDDTISIEYDQGTATDYISIAINKNVFDGADTILFESLVTAINTAAPVADRDLAAQLWTGGQVDPVARPARGFKINNNSVVLAKAPTDIRVKLKRTGTFAATDKILCKLIKWTTKASVITIAEKLCNDISSTAFVEYIFQNTNNAYPMEVGDLISFESNFGNSTTQFIEIQVSKPPSQDDAGNKDNIYTAMFEYNGQTYADDLLRDVIGSISTGGYTVYPDPSIPLPPTPYHYYHGWHLSAALPPDSGAIIDPKLLAPKQHSYFHNIADQFRLYSRILTTQQILNYFQNRWTITGIGFGHIEVVGYEFVPYNSAL